jgi:hypothetical protein
MSARRLFPNLQQFPCTFVNPRKALTSLFREKTAFFNMYFESADQISFLFSPLRDCRHNPARRPVALAAAVLGVKEIWPAANGIAGRGHLFESSAGFAREKLEPARRALMDTQCLKARMDRSKMFFHGRAPW